MSFHKKTPTVKCQLHRIIYLQNLKEASHPMKIHQVLSSHNSLITNINLNNKYQYLSLVVEARQRENFLKI